MFYEKEQFAFYQKLEENWEAIRDEYLQLREIQKRGLVSKVSVYRRLEGLWLF